jgi:hypothetical protein
MLLSCRDVIAQNTNRLGGNWSKPTNATITNIIVKRYGRGRVRSAPSNRTPAPGQDEQLRFTSTGAPVKAREIANAIDAGNPQVVTILTTILTEYEKGARAAGKPNDLALALSFFLATNASLYHGGGEPPDPQMMELRETIAQALVEANALKGVTDREKQEMYETLVLFTGFALAVYQEGVQGGNADGVKVGRQLAGQNLQAFASISPDKINFSNEGLSIDVPQTEEPSNIASAPSAPSQDIPDPFPDRPGYAPQKPLAGKLKGTIAIQDIVGTWDHNEASVQGYVDSSTGNYAGTSTVFYGERYIIRPNGTFEYLFAGRASNHTIRESDRGTVILSGGYVTLKFAGRSAEKYQLIAFMTQANGGAVLSLVEVHDGFAGYDPQTMAIECGHSRGYISCSGGEEWVRVAQ